MNAIQTLGSHNRYHIQPRDSILAVMRELEDAGSADPETTDILEYTALPLQEQFERGVRERRPAREHGLWGPQPRFWHHVLGGRSRRLRRPVQPDVGSLRMRLVAEYDPRRGTGLDAERGQQR